MANNTIQEVSCVTAKWDAKFAQPHQNAFSTGKFPEPGLLNETMEVVKEKVWSFRHALKGVAEAFCRMGVSPTVVGYSYSSNNLNFDCLLLYAINCFASEAWNNIFLKMAWTSEICLMRGLSYAQCMARMPWLCDFLGGVCREFVYMTWYAYLNISRSVPLHEDGYVIEQSEDVLALAKVDADEDKPPLKPTILLLRNLSNHSAPEDDNLLREEDEREEDIDHGFAESSRKKLDERKSLTRSGGY